MLYRKLTQDELHQLARERFGDDPMQWAFRCPNCDDVATLAEFVAAGADPGRTGQECIGRSLGALTKPSATNRRGCDFSAYGLIPGPWEIVFPADVRRDRPEPYSVRSFPLADAREGGEPQ